MMEEEDKGKGLLESKDSSNINGNAEIAASQSGSVKMDVEIVGSGSNPVRSRKPVKGDSMGMIFMCNAKTKQDCFHYKVLGMPGSKREMVSKIYKGMRLFLFDIDLRLLYGIYKAVGPGSYNIEPKAFNSAFPSQVRFTVLEDCLPLGEEKFKVAIKDNYFGKNKFDSLLKPEQVKNLCKLFTPAGTRSKQGIGVTEARSYVDRSIDRVSRPGFIGDKLLPKESGLYSESFASSVQPSQLPPTIPHVYSYDQPLGAGYHRSDTSHGDHNRWILHMEIKRQEDSKKRDSNNAHREYPVYPDPLYPQDLQPSFPPHVDVQSGYPPPVDQSSYQPMNLQSGYPPSRSLQQSYPPMDLQSGYAPSRSLQQSYPSMDLQSSYPPPVDLRSSYPPPVDLQSSYPPLSLQRSYPPTTLPPSSLSPHPPLYRY